MEELDVGGTTWKVKAEILPRKETVLGALLMHQLDARLLSFESDTMNLYSGQCL